MLPEDANGRFRGPDKANMTHPKTLEAIFPPALNVLGAISGTKSMAFHMRRVQNS